MAAGHGTDHKVRAADPAGVTVHFAVQLQPAAVAVQGRPQALGRLPHPVQMEEEVLVGEEL